jgi:hypothetical protein
MEPPNEKRKAPEQLGGQQERAGTLSASSQRATSTSRRDVCDFLRAPSFDNFLRAFPNFVGKTDTSEHSTKGKEVIKEMRKLKHRSAYSNRSYFRASDFPETRILKTEDIREEVIEGSLIKKPQLVAYFEGECMGLVLNQTNQDMLEFLSGSGWPDDWIGLTVEVFCEHGVRSPNGGTTDGVRLRRAKQPAQPHPPVPLSQRTSKSLDDANSELAAAATDTDEIPY